MFLRTQNEQCRDIIDIGMNIGMNKNEDLLAIILCICIG